MNIKISGKYSNHFTLYIDRLTFAESKKIQETGDRSEIGKAIADKIAKLLSQHEGESLEILKSQDLPY